MKRLLYKSSVLIFTITTLMPASLALITLASRSQTKQMPINLQKENLLERAKRKLSTFNFELNAQAKNSLPLQVQNLQELNQLLLTPLKINQDLELSLVAFSDPSQGILKINFILKNQKNEQQLTITKTLKGFQNTAQKAQLDLLKAQQKIVDFNLDQAILLLHKQKLSALEAVSRINSLTTLNAFLAPQKPLLIAQQIKIELSAKLDKVNSRNFLLQFQLSKEKLEKTFTIKIHGFLSHHYQHLLTIKENVLKLSLEQNLLASFRRLTVKAALAQINSLEALNLYLKEAGQIHLPSTITFTFNIAQATERSLLVTLNLRKADTSLAFSFSLSGLLSPQMQKVAQEKSLLATYDFNQLVNSTFKSSLTALEFSQQYPNLAAFNKLLAKNAIRAQFGTLITLKTAVNAQDLDRLDLIFSISLATSKTELTVSLSGFFPEAKRSVTLEKQRFENFALEQSLVPDLKTKLSAREFARSVTSLATFNLMLQANKQLHKRNQLRYHFEVRLAHDDLNSVTIKITISKKKEKASVLKTISGFISNDFLEVKKDVDLLKALDLNAAFSLEAKKTHTALDLETLINEQNNMLPELNNFLNPATQIEPQHQTLILVKAQAKINNLVLTFEIIKNDASQVVTKEITNFATLQAKALARLLKMLKSFNFNKQIAQSYKDQNTAQMAAAAISDFASLKRILKRPLVLNLESDESITLQTRYLDSIKQLSLIFNITKGNLEKSLEITLGGFIAPAQLDLNRAYQHFLAIDFNSRVADKFHTQSASEVLQRFQKNSKEIGSWRAFNDLFKEEQKLKIVYGVNLEVALSLHKNNLEIILTLTKAGALGKTIPGKSLTNFR